MGTPVGQTPGILTLAPGDAGYDAACAAALKACGVNPDSFDSYKGRCSAIEAAGDRCEANGVTAANLDHTNVDDYLTANSQSGHMAQNAIFQAAGRRGDECANVPPASTDPSAPSSFGYSCNGAPCTDHFGTSTLGGSCHGEISRVSEKTTGWSERGVERGSRIGPSDIEAQVEASARIHVDANRGHRARPAGSDDPAQVESLSNAQRMNAERLTADDPEAQALLNPSGAEPGAPAGASSPGPSSAVKDFAAKCEVTKWKQLMAKMRADAINESPLGQAAREQHGCDFTELSQQEQRDMIRGNPELFGTPPPGPPPNAPTPSQPGVNAPPKTTRRGDPPTTADCQAYQGNYLAWQTAYNPSGSASRTEPGTMPPWGGRAPTGARPGTTQTTGARDGDPRDGF